MFNYVNNRKSIRDIYEMFSENRLVVDESYQRRSVWSEKDNIRLIETILLNLLIPVLFFWKAETDPDSGKSIIHIVDGQQRVKAIDQFVQNKYKLKKTWLMNDSIKERYGNKCFKDFSPDERKSFWNYQLMIIDIDANATRDDIITMFNRLNLTDYSLNDQEKRNSLSGEFGALARELSDMPIWEDKKLFNNSDIKRMKDIEFCASLILLCKKGIIDQTDQTELNQAYNEYQTDYKDAEEDKNKVQAAINVLPDFLTNEMTLKFLKKKTQLYTLFCFIFYMQREKAAIEEAHIHNLDLFVELYSAFDNDNDISDQLDENEKTIYDLLKKYKLSSSEGLNKYTNRMIRSNTMKDFIINIPKKMYASEETLLERLKQSYGESTE